MCRASCEPCPAILHHVIALCEELWGFVQERELQADLQQLLAQLVVGAGQPQGLPALLPAVQQTAKRVLGLSCTVASFSPADSAQLQLLSWLADLQVIAVSCSATTAKVSSLIPVLCHSQERTE